MNLLLRNLTVFALVSALAGCSLYKSSGRKQFEEKSPTQINPEMKGLSDGSDCWVQSKNEPLLDLNDDSQYSVESINSEELLVCNESP